MKRIVAYCWGLLWHKLEIELIRVGEPFQSGLKNFWGVINQKFTFKATKIKSNLFPRQVRIHYSTHSNNNLTHPTLYRRGYHGND
jgi:hypothetical protein